MKAVFNACYVAIFLQFVRKIMDKVNISLETCVSLSRHDDSDNYYVTVSGKPVLWENDKDIALSFCLDAMSTCRSLAGKFGIIQDEKDMDLVAPDTIPGLTLDEILTLNECIEKAD